MAVFALSFVSQKKSNFDLVNDFLELVCAVVELCDLVIRQSVEDLAADAVAIDQRERGQADILHTCLLYTSDAADEL